MKYAFRQKERVNAGTKNMRESCNSFGKCAYIHGVARKRTTAQWTVKWKIEN
jgi:hypothetical protein